ncbi:23S rRNA (guanine2445-N2)-methyltransferase / 23S rRNA (guanine2069-N7)-methyltransferase [Allopseudospirillum japonicum]|uniref:Ribosomal RNA large subunit methyltransferase K/L n=1 Tax=Allopseudospirillum japonicum TaxID=64971 RepID=A0A1H6TJF4_9GAMM|nr:bifunctional 23S rRNA (guanine(2069)-N(7))-methyltransferase RlmK/23S rRNA (guanine(2445)-N(2))-methyltransferase RlmL [Allopseudospirillum japonicum]SEI75882.1 23S rRNA (guanine2445-N2)-methyltransferase / 23S rRNA (guanine2069-N7)-methyltransferase [Allopseudospirillum japonicum]
MTTETPYILLATCPLGLESLLAEELASLGAYEIKESFGAVSWQADLATAYKACLWSRLANRILLYVDSAIVEDENTLYQAAYAVNWLQHLNKNTSFAVDFKGTSKLLKHTHHSALKVKDAIVDQVRNANEGERPNIDTQEPDVRVWVKLNKSQVYFYIDLSGNSLHQRGYRLQGASAPLKENLAAALLIRAGWPRIASQGGALIDPMCGSGTLLIEGTLIAADIAPNLHRQYFGFLGWLQHDPHLWKKIWLDAKERSEQGLQKKLPLIYGYDASIKAIEAAKSNIETAGLSQYIGVMKKEIKDLVQPTHQGKLENQGLVIVNPPYGERLSDLPAMMYLYAHLGEKLREHYHGWEFALFTANVELAKQTGLRKIKDYKYFNGALECRLYLFKIIEEYYHARIRSGQTWAQHLSIQAPQDAQLESLSEGGRMLLNRLQKNHKKLAKWLQKEKITSYRLYDADMPEYAVAIDIYGQDLHVQEYAPPASIDTNKAQERLFDVLKALSVLYGVREKNIHLKQRKRQAGKSQYKVLDNQGQYIQVQEGLAKVLVNLDDYLDTGLFLDHRPIRLQIAALAKGKRFLNLFCYTGVASIHAALGGATSSVSVDMSNTYLEWFKNNLALNGLSESKHKAVQSDCIQWLKQNKQRFDIIFLDPPTFSNSKRMRETLDIQRDHVGLVELAMQSLEKDGVLIFSNNYRRFKIDENLIKKYQVKDISKSSIPEDFKRNTHIHVCFEIRWPQDQAQVPQQVQDVWQDALQQQKQRRKLPRKPLKIEKS